MFKELRLKRASSIVEYMLVLMFLLGTVFVFQGYILRGFAGRWKSVGDVFGGGRQYDPKAFNEGGTLECFFYSTNQDSGAGYWVATRCYEDCLRQGTPSCPFSVNGFGNPGDMSCCRDECDQYKSDYQYCNNTNFSI